MTQDRIAEPRGARSPHGPGALRAEVLATESMLEVSRTMTAIVARTLADVAEQVSVPQLRTLVLLRTRGPMSLSTLARHLGVNASNASRACDQLVASERVQRGADPQDGRVTLLQLTRPGEAFVERLMEARRELISQVVARMTPDQQRLLHEGLSAFAAAAANAPSEESVGLPDGRIIPWLV